MPEDAETTAGQQRGKPFTKGQSGNPSGRPSGARHKTTLAIEALFDGEAEELSRKAIELAKGGDMAALRLCMDRVMPPRKDRAITFNLPPIATAQEAAQASTALLAAVASGELSPSEANEIAKLIDVHVKTLEATDLAERLERLERMTAQ